MVGVATLMINLVTAMTTGSRFSGDRMSYRHWSDWGSLVVVRLLWSILAAQLLHALATAIGTLSPSTAAQQPRQFWKGRAAVATRCPPRGKMTRDRPSGSTHFAPQLYFERTWSASWICCRNVSLRGGDRWGDASSSRSSRR